MSEELKEFQAAYESGDYTKYYSYLLDYAEAQFNKTQELNDLLTQISYDKAIHESDMHKILKLEEENSNYREALEVAFLRLSNKYDIDETRDDILKALEESE